MFKTIETEKRFFKQLKGKPHFATVVIQVTCGIAEPQLKVECSGKGLDGFSQGDLLDVPAVGYEDWKKAALVGVAFALKCVPCLDCSVVVTKIVGRDFTDTNSSIVAVVAAYAVWEVLEYNPNDSQTKKLEEILSKSWELPVDLIPEF